jgi:predicted O-methyltransferase YrrM
MSLIDPAALDAICEMAGGTPPGDFVEIGVYKGGSAYRLAEVARRQARRLWLFDTFTGIPEATPEYDLHKIGDFSDTSLVKGQKLIPDARFVVGDAREMLPSIDTGPVAFAHLDCDQYDTYRACIIELMPRMVRGGVMWFDDVYALDGAKRAVAELLGDLVKEHECQRHYVRF